MHAIHAHILALYISINYVLAKQLAYIDINNFNIYITSLSIQILCKFFNLIFIFVTQF